MRWGRLLVRLAAVLGGLSALVFLLFAGALLALRSPAVQEAAISRLQPRLEAMGIEAQSIGGDWPGEVIVRGLTIRDADGVYAEAALVRARLSPWALLGRVLLVERLEIEGLRLRRLPRDRQPSAGGGLRWPQLPGRLTVRSVSADLALDRRPPFAPAILAVEGGLSMSSGDGELRLQAVRTEGPRFALEASLSATSNLRRLSVNLVGEDADLLASLIGEGRVEGAVWALRLDRRRGEMMGSLELATPRLGRIEGRIEKEGRFRLHASEIGGFAAGGPIRGPIGAQGLLTDLGARGMSLKGEIDPSALRLSSEGLEDALAKSRIGFELTAGEGALKITSLEVDAPRLAARATGALEIGEARRMSGAFALDLADASRVTSAARGSLGLKSSLSGSLSEPLVDVEARGRDIAAAGLHWPSLLAEAHIEPSRSGHARAAAEGDVPFDLSATFGPSGDLLRIGPLTGEIAGGRASGEISRSGDGVSARLRVAGADLGAIGPLAAAKLAGDMSADIRAATSPGGVRIDARITSAAGRAGPGGGLAWRRLKATANGSTEDIAVALESDLLLADEPATLRATARLDGGSRRLRIERADLRSGETRIALVGAANLDFGPELLLGPVQLGLEQQGRPFGKATLSLARRTQGTEVKIAAEDVRLQPLSFVPVAGTLSGVFDFDGAAATATLSAEIKNLRARRASGLNLPRADVAISGDWRDGLASLRAIGSLADAPPAELLLKARVPQDRPGAFPQLDPAAEVEGTIAWRGDVGPLWPLFGIEGHRLSGAGELAGTVGGSIGKPSLGGSARLTGGRYQSALIGLTLSDLEASVTSVNGEARIEASAHDGNAGRVSASGGFDTADPFGTLLVSLQADEAHLVRRDDVSAHLTGSVSLAPVADGLSVGGSLRATRVRVTVPKPLPPDVIVIDVIDPEAPARRAPISAARRTIGLDIAVDVPGPATVEGRGLSSLWRGSGRVLGTMDAPRIDGRLVLMRGGLDFAGRTLRLTSGTIFFDGTRTIDPRVDIVAEATTSNLEAEVALRGRVSELRLEATSTPARPQEEVLAQVLFGKRIEELTAVEGLQLAQSVAALSGTISSGNGLLQRLKEAIGVDVIEFGGDAAGGFAGTTVTLGKYLRDGVYVGVRSGAAPGASRGTVEIEVSDEITLETEIGSDRSGSVGVNWTHDY